MHAVIISRDDNQYGHGLQHERRSLGQALSKLVKTVRKFTFARYDWAKLFMKL